MESTFWSDGHTKEWQRLRRYQQIYEGTHEVVLHDAEGGWSLPIYVVHNWLGDRYTNTVSTLIWRRFPALYPEQTARADDLTRLLTGTGLRRVCRRAQRVVSWGGYASLKLWKPTRFALPRIRRWGSKPGEFCWWELEGGLPWAVTFYRQEQYTTVGGRQATAMVGERFELTDAGDVLVTNAAYEAADGFPDTRKPLDLQLVNPETPLEPEARLAMPVLPAFLWEGEGIGASDYTESLLSLQRSQARLATQRDIAIAVNEMPVINYPVSMLQPDGRVDLGKLWISFREPGQDPQEVIPINFNSWNGNLAESATQWTLNEQSFRTLTGLPPGLDGVAEGGGESGYARVLGLTKVVSLVESRQQDAEALFEWAGQAVPPFARALGLPDDYGGQPIENISARWLPPVPEDENEKSQRIERAVGKGWMSLKTAIEEEHRDELWTPEQVEKELDEIMREADYRAERAMAAFGRPQG